MKNTCVKLLIPLLAIGLMTGCSGSSQKETGISVDEDGIVTSVIIEDFDQSLYSVSELSDLIDKEVSEYNSLNGADKVTAESPEAGETDVTVTMTYSTADDYAAFNNRRLSIENLSDAISDGTINAGFVSAKDNSPVDPASIDKPEKYNILITDEVGSVTTPGKIVYFSTGVEKIGSKEARVTENMDGLAYIIYVCK